MENEELRVPKSAFDSPTFGQDGSFKLDKPVGSASISPCGRDVVLASRHGLHIIDLDSPWAPPRFLAYHTPWEVADVQWSPFAARDFWVVSTSNQKALIWNLNMPNPKASVEHVLHAHSRAISDINFSAHHPDVLATCAVDSFVHCWDIRHPRKPAISFCDWFSGATQVKWNRQNSHILASSHDKFLRIWDDRKGTHPLKSIEAHATKIYGVDWDRLETNRIATCSLDKTIKVWNYSNECDHPEYVIDTPFPVWRARHTPFGAGLLAMPQRGNNNLHLYHLGSDEHHTEYQQTEPVHAFVGHNDQVREFLWRTRGNVTDTMDERDFQLVSWGADKVLRLHHVNNEILEDVGYKKGMEVRRTTGFTRRGATYRSFRDDPSTDKNRSSQIHTQRDIRANADMGLGPLCESNNTSLSINGKRRSSRNTTRTIDDSKSREMDPITWMRGVRIGKRSTLPVGLHESVSTILSPNPKPEGNWDVFDSLGEEITHLGERFTKISFTEVDVSHRKLILSLSGPWGANRTSTHLRIGVDFPNEYPRHAMPRVDIERTASLAEDRLKQISADIEMISAGFLANQRSSLETIVRYLIGEQDRNECLQSLRKTRHSQDLIMAQDEALSSSDEDDEELGTFANVNADAPSNDQSSINIINATYNVPLRRTCGALWSGNGTLVCFFPTKQREGSLLDQSLGTSDRMIRMRNPVSEGFGRLSDVLGGRKGPKTSLEAADSGDLGYDGYSTTSSDSSLDSEPRLPQSYFLPAIGWHGMGLEPYSKISFDESQKSSGETGAGISSATRGSMLVSIYEMSDLLPAKRPLAQQYIIGSGHKTAFHNAAVASQNGFRHLSQVWSFIELILRDEVPFEIMHNPRDGGSAVAVVKHALSVLRKIDSKKDVGYDADMEDSGPNLRKPVQWGEHPLGRGWLIDNLFDYYEQIADVQMLAMMACAFNFPEDTPRTDDSSTSNFGQPFPLNSQPSPYYRSLEVALSVFVKYGQQQSHINPSLHHSAASSTVVSMVDHAALSSENNTPPSYMPFRQAEDRRFSHDSSLSTSPEHQRHMHHSSSSISAYNTMFPIPFSFSSSPASSPPNIFPKKKLSPSGTHLPIASSGLTWASANLLSKAPVVQDELKGSFSVSLSDHEDEIHPAASPGGPILITTLKNQDKFPGEGCVNNNLLDAQERPKYSSYRKAYAQLLDIWQIPIARCELLKASSIHTKGRISQTSDSLTLGRAQTHSTMTAASPSSSLRVAQICRNCSEPAAGSPNSGFQKCLGCRRPFPPPNCAYCHTYIRGLSSACLACNHQVHASCRASLELTDDLKECPTGCGCICTDYLSSVKINLLKTQVSNFKQSRTLESEHHRTLSSQVSDTNAQGTHLRNSLDGDIAAITDDDFDDNFTRLGSSSDLAAHASSSERFAVDGDVTPVPGAVSSSGSGQGVGQIAYESLIRNLRINKTRF